MKTVYLIRWTLGVEIETNSLSLANGGKGVGGEEGGGGRKDHNFGWSYQ